MTDSLKIEITRFVDCVFDPADIVEVRRLPSTKSTWHTAQELSDQADTLTAENEAAQNIYVGANPQAERGGTTNERVATARCLFVDLENITSEDAIARITEAGLPRPTLLLSSGHGVHCYWRLSEPMIDLAAWKAAQKQLIAALKATGADADRCIHDLARIMRLPGFLNRKPDKDAVSCTIIESDSNRRYPLDTLLAVLPTAEPTDSRSVNSPTVATTNLATLARAAAYISTIEGAAEGGRNQKAFRVAAVLQNDFGLSPADAESLLRKWNEKNNPPLDDAELGNVLRNADKYGSAAPYSKLEPFAGLQVEASATAGNRLLRVVEYERFTAAELDSQEFVTEYLIDGLIVAKQPLILAGSKKSLKTSLLLDAAVSLGTATPFLGKFPVGRVARTAVMSGESGLATIQETLRRICDARSKELKQVGGLIVSPDLPRFGDSGHQAALEKFITTDEIEVLALDPAYLCMPGADAGNLFIQGELLKSISDVCQRKGVTLLLCHHTKKGNGVSFAPPELEDISWAGFQEFARQWLLLGRRERYEPGTGDHKLWLSVGGSAGHSGLWALDIREGVYSPPTSRFWEVTVSNVEEARSESHKRAHQQRMEEKSQAHSARVEAIKAKIAETLRAVPGHADTKTGIMDRTGAKGRAFDDAFASMLSQGLLCQTELKRGNGHSYPAYQLELALAA